MEKPITVIRQEFKENLVEVINDSGLAFFVIEPILQELLSAVREAMDNKLKEDMAQYQEFLHQQKGEFPEEQPAGEGA